ncbi:bifunctional 2-C-methyl-D-erythritol 4-phosphate cytidylyltransferase/2-C-methyl-D-erythritol 2,4-cyclodiphosphate synthase [Pseudophaeobacter flagellatus]|uniref:bifunctional 2-C-methyl-D-erythritol 4-phosphate cytidylyltransferase/2-C-methyl-D-erythritol 2,4-cyclodiphosphate synthase n=1 Tax=Pseudophaeobacter flagellatus TaxID=2899119 RepID=UPI001E286F95|nr:bifunctional 2-C-methyl-D-erythritol 4-phosphate cytidylyltransferase/2-C-methyl-D-erythritol 2,4-cyclodiphosphate synthase [Pseudophaeobacter flagellatus]MCD9146855.1 bifunctional 2-C-methyl-D-erythritol 4-phosphate cytidylyltransferase/2-C-methyl-D-erythritol 2,4-cyclodiphosphate synthase [Pseudophaeobacter flagellatus]
MTTAALIVAAGRGSRVGGGLPKQWRDLKDRRVIDWTLKAFRDAQVKTIALVLSPLDQPAWDSFADAQDIILAKGGAERAQSVQNGLRALQGQGITKVLIHDAARPCTSPALINTVIEALDSAAAAAPALAITDALWTGVKGRVSGTQDRTALFGAQTPQGFHYDAILAAHAAHPGGAADDVEVARAAGLDVVIVAGDPDNIKITRPEDFARAARILETENTMTTSATSLPDIRLGNGYDVHRFGPGDSVTLCGVTVPYERGLQGHSDADVGMHAVTDAIYGALSQGDIGQHFPPSDPQWKGAASDIFLRHAADLAKTMGFHISNVDCTLVCEFPKIGPHAAEMRAVMAEILGLDPTRVSIKATTSERLGFTGRGEGIASLATATLVKP